MAFENIKNILLNSLKVYFNDNVALVFICNLVIFSGSVTELVSYTIAKTYSITPPLKKRQTYIVHAIANKTYVIQFQLASFWFITLVMSGQLVKYGSASPPSVRITGRFRFFGFSFLCTNTRHESMMTIIYYGYNNIDNTFSLAYSCAKPNHMRSDVESIIKVCINCGIHLNNNNNIIFIYIYI